jgi:hypothetical protein
LCSRGGGWRERRTTVAERIELSSTTPKWIDSAKQNADLISQ